jgi:dienelactone hydrolase
VLLHTCGGIRPHVRLWAARLEEAGLASLIVDSFTWRGAAECSIPHFVPASVDEAAGDDTPNVAQNCAGKVEALRRAGRPVDIILYPGAGHVFDSRDSPDTRAAGEDRLAFFRRHLAGPGRDR